MAKQVVFLCTGNICRSPVAEAVARGLYGHLALRFASAGLEPNPGWGASDGSRAYAAARGWSLAGHQSRPVTPAMLAEAAWVIGMTRSHAAIFRSRSRGVFGGSIGVLGAPGVDLAGSGISPAVEEVADPYGQPERVYRDMGEQISRLLELWADEFRALAS